MFATPQLHPPSHPCHSITASEGRSSANHRMIKLNRRRRHTSNLFLPLVLCLYVITFRIPLTIFSEDKHRSVQNPYFQSVGSSFFIFASASPIPEPSPSRSKHSTHRFPPINGSIFGKRSLDALVNTLDSNSSDRSMKLEDIFLKRYQDNKQNEDKTHPPNYQDIITELIEDFMALNNESNPEQATESFCRMIVYECQQMLVSKSKSSGNKINKKYRR